MACGERDDLQPPPRRLPLVYTLVGVVAFLLFVAIAGAVGWQTARALIHGSALPQGILVVALLLNLILIPVGWRRQPGFVISARRWLRRTGARSAAGTGAKRRILHRDSFLEQGAAMLQRAARLEKSMAILMLDIDSGAPADAALLRAVAGEVAATMPALTLTAQVAPERLAYGFLFDPDAGAAIDRIAERLVLRLAQPFTISGRDVQARCALGAARSDRGCTDMSALLLAAEAAMALAKKAGGSRFAWFDQATQTAHQHRQQLKHALPAAVAREEVVPFFEQQVDLASGALEGFEVLARWEHPEQGMIGPDMFIGIAEESGLIADLSLSVMAQAFRAARDWHPSLSLSVNISPVQLRDAWLAQKIIKVLTETGFPASRLEVEITERALFDNLALTQSLLGSLKNQGIRIALDDFGTGYSSLAHLRALPFDRIKIDRSFVQLLNRNTDSAAIVNAIVRMGESLNLPITAEGVEDAAIAARLLALGCAKAQGWHFGRPLSIAGARRMLAERRLILQPSPPLPGGPPTNQRQAG